PLDGGVDVLGGAGRDLLYHLGGGGIENVHRCAHSVRRIPLSRVSRWASATGTIVTARIRKTTTFTCGSCWPRRIWPKIQIGRVFWAPAVNVVTITSSKERAKASRPPEIRAVEIVGNVTERKVCRPSPPRSMEASVGERGTRRRRATTL